MRPYRKWSLRGMRTFCVAARLSSFRLAAEELFVTGSAVSHQIKNLEDELGERLFERQGRNLILTPHGQALFQELNPLLQQIDELAQRWQDRTTRRPLRVSAQPFFASELLVPRLKHFAQKNAGIDIQLESSDETPHKHPPGADVSIRLFRQPPDDLGSDLLFPLELVPACSPETAELIKGQRFYDFPFDAIIHSGRKNAWRRWAHQLSVTLPEPAGIHKMDTMLAVVGGAEQGLGIALVPRRLAQGRFDSGHLVQLHQHSLQLKESYYLVYEKPPTDDCPVALFRRWILQEFARLP